MMYVEINIDTIKLGDKIATKIDKNIEDSEMLEKFVSKMSDEEKLEFSSLVTQAVHGVVCHFDCQSGVLS